LIRLILILLLHRVLNTQSKLLLLGRLPVYIYFFIIDLHLNFQNYDPALMSESRLTFFIADQIPIIYENRIKLFSVY
jgi:hypothetical protein